MWLLAPFRLLGRTVQRFHQERLTQIAAALSFVTLLGLVPTMVVAFAVVSSLPIGSGLSVVLEKFLLANLLPDRAGAVIAKYVSQFAARGGRMTALGIGFVGVTAVLQMLTIERSINEIWRTRSKRSLWRRLAVHSAALLLGPVLFGVGLIGVSFVATASLGLLNEPRWVEVLILNDILPSILMAGLMALFYWGVPDTPIVKWHAAVGGFLAALGFYCLHKLFSLYISLFATGTLMYGAFSAIPVFLTWIYVSWSVVLLGALVVAELPLLGRPSRSKRYGR